MSSPPKIGLDTPMPSPATLFRWFCNSRVMWVVILWLPLQMGSGSYILHTNAGRGASVGGCCLSEPACALQPHDLRHPPPCLPGTHCNQPVQSVGITYSPHYFFSGGSSHQHTSHGNRLSFLIFLSYISLNASFHFPTVLWR